VVVRRARAQLCTLVAKGELVAKERVRSEVGRYLTDKNTKLWELMCAVS
jgi:hypothetical protein